MPRRENGDDLTEVSCIKLFASMDREAYYAECYLHDD